MQYGAVVKRARRARGLTQADLAEISGVDQPNISAIESGRRQPSAATLHQLLLACGFEVLAVAGDRVIPFPASPDDAAGDVAVDPSPRLTPRERARTLRGVLETSEAVLRARR